MTDFRKLISHAIKEKRPKLSESSVQTYVSTLFNLHKHLQNVLSLQNVSSDLDFFTIEEPAILEFITDSPSRARKADLSASYVITEKPSYREKMIDDCKIVNNQYKEQKKDTREQENWISVDEVKAKYDDLLNKVKSIFNQKMVGDTKTIMDFFLIALLGGVNGLAPRRSLDMALLKIRNYDKTKDNYYKSGKLYFNQYKTSAKYGLQKVDVPPELNTIIKKWIKINSSDYMLFSSSNMPLTSSQITRMLNKIFDGKKISTDMLRHIYLTDLYKAMPSLLSMEKTASNMGHSIQTALTYVKRD